MHWNKKWLWVFPELTEKEKNFFCCKILNLLTNSYLPCVCGGRERGFCFVTTNFTTYCEHLTCLRAVCTIRNFTPVYKVMKRRKIRKSACIRLVTIINKRQQGRQHKSTLSEPKNQTQS